MPELSSLFGARPRQGRPTGFETKPKANQFKRSIVMQEALERDLAPDDGADFYKFVGRRLFELGDTEGALAVSAQAQQILGRQAQAQAEAEQQQFERTLAARKDSRETAAAGIPKPPAIRKFKRGTTEVTEQFDPATGTFKEISTGNAFAPPNNININSGGSDLGNELAALRNDPNISPKAKEAIEAALITDASKSKESETIAAQTGNVKALDDQLKPALREYRSAAQNLIDKPSLENKKKFEAARGTLVLATAGRNNTKGEPSGPVLDAADAMIPGIAGIATAHQFGQDVAGAVVDQISAQFGYNGGDRTAEIAAELGIDPSRIQSIEIIEE